MRSRLGIKNTLAIFVGFFAWWGMRHLSTALLAPASVVGAYLLGCCGLALAWGVEAAVCSGRVWDWKSAGGAGVSTVLLAGAALGVMAIPHHPTEAWCTQPGTYCEDFSAVLLAYSCWLVSLVTAGVALVAGAVGRSLATAVNAHRCREDIYA